MAVSFRSNGDTVYVNNCDANKARLTSDVLEHLHDLEKLRLRKYPILLISDPQYMRGYNYRSAIGINLFICRGFKTARDVLQAKGRVGRYHDPCERFRTVESLEDPVLKREYLRTLQ